MPASQFADSRLRAPGKVSHSPSHHDTAGRQRSSSARAVSAGSTLLLVGVDLLGLPRPTPAPTEPGAGRAHLLVGLHVVGPLALPPRRGGEVASEHTLGVLIPRHLPAVEALERDELARERVYVAE